MKKEKKEDDENTSVERRWSTCPTRNSTITTRVTRVKKLEVCVTSDEIS